MIFKGSFTCIRNAIRFLDTWIRMPANFMHFWIKWIYKCVGKWHITLDMKSTLIQLFSFSCLLGYGSPEFRGNYRCVSTFIICLSPFNLLFSVMFTDFSVLSICFLRRKNKSYYNHCPNNKLWGPMHSIKSGTLQHYYK